jgi:Zn-dependent protease
MHWWGRWAYSENLSRISGFPYLSLVVIASLAAVLVHECGHAIAGLVLGMKLSSFVVGPLQWRIRDDRWTFKFEPGALLSVGGATGVVPADPQQSHWEQICMIAAGPFASFCTGLLAVCATVAAPGHSWEAAWQLLALFATISLLGGVLNLIPVQAKTFYSDGAQIYQLLAGGPWADYHRTISIASSTLVTPLRPRDYDIEAMQRAAGAIKHGPRGLHLRLLASTHYFDCGRYPEANQALSEAELISQSITDIPVGWHYEFVFGKAILQRDAVGARLWWERLEAKKPERNWDYWRSRSALLWIENCRQEADEAWKSGNILVQQLSKAGANEFHKYTFLVLRQALDESVALAQPVN